MEADTELARQMIGSQLFESLTTDELAELNKVAKTEIRKEGDVVIAEADEGDSFYWVKAGRLEVQIHNILKPAPLTLNIIKAGEVFGEMILLGKSRRTASVIVRNETSLLVWKYKDVLALFQKNPDMGYKVMTSLVKMLSDRLLDMNLQLRNHTELLGSNLSKYF